MKIADASMSDLRVLRARIETKLENVHTLEEAGQKFVEEVYQAFQDSIVLLRLFITIPMAELPSQNQIFVNDLARKAQLAVPLPPESSVLSLFGTVGINPSWNNRRNSQAHLGIPLATPDFINAIPMMSTLLEQLGFDLGWIRGDPELVARKLGSMSGTFYVAEAKTAKDHQGRLIIAAQDFVQHYDIQTVFGVGGGYVMSNKFLTTIFFTRESLEKQKTLMFQSFANSFKTKTVQFIRDKTLYFQ